MAPRFVCGPVRRDGAASGAVAGGIWRRAQRRLDAATRWCSPRLRNFYDHMGGLDRRDGQDAGFELQLGCRLRRHQRDHSKRPTLEIDLSHHGVLHDSGDQAGEPVSGALGDRTTEGWGGRNLLCVYSQLGAVDHSPPGANTGAQASRLDPAPYGVVRDAKQAGRLGDPILRHLPSLTAASADQLGGDAKGWASTDARPKLKAGRTNGPLETKKAGPERDPPLACA